MVDSLPLDQAVLEIYEKIELSYDPLCGQKIFDPESGFFGILKKNQSLQNFMEILWESSLHLIKIFWELSEEITKLSYNISYWL